MPSYNEIDGVPSHANRWLLEDVLRGEWGYRGAVVSDYYAIEDMARLHLVPGGQNALHHRFGGRGQKQAFSGNRDMFRFHVHVPTLVGASVVCSNLVENLQSTAAYYPVSRSPRSCCRSDQAPCRYWQI